MPALSFPFVLVTVQSIGFTHLSIDLPMETADKRAVAGALKKATSPTAATPALVQRLERAADDHGRRFAASPAPARGKAIARASRPATSPGGALRSSAGAGTSAGDVSSTLRMSKGSPLAPDLRTHLESHFGQDLSSVRVHTDGPAGDAAGQLQAKAFALGNDVYFGPGQWSPGTSQGRSLIGHEIAHVVQYQRGLTGLDANKKATNVQIGSSRLERFAEDHEHRLSGTWGRGGGSSQGIQNFDIVIDPGTSPFARDAVERIGVAAVEKASALLGAELRDGTVDEIHVRATIDLAHGEQNAVERLADSIVKTARSAAAERALGRTTSPHSVYQLARFVADSGMFMDRFIKEDATGSKAKAVMEDKNHEIVYSDTILGEVTRNDKFKTQEPRLLGGVNPGAKREKVIDSNPAIDALVNRFATGALPTDFGLDDLRILATAYVNGLPLITWNKNLQKQVNGHPGLREQFWGVPILFAPDTAQIDAKASEAAIKEAEDRWKAISSVANMNAKASILATLADFQRKSADIVARLSQLMARTGQPNPLNAPPDVLTRYVNLRAAIAVGMPAAAAVELANKRLKVIRNEFFDRGRSGEAADARIKWATQEYSEVATFIGSVPSVGESERTAIRGQCAAALAAFAPTS